MKGGYILFFYSIILVLLFGCITVETKKKSSELMKEYPERYFETKDQAIFVASMIYNSSGKWNGTYYSKLSSVLSKLSYSYPDYYVHDPVVPSNYMEEF